MLAGRKFPVRRNFNNAVQNGKLVQWKNHGPESSNGSDCPCPPPSVSLPSTPCHPGATIPCSREAVAGGLQPPSPAMGPAELSPHPDLAKPIPTELPGAGAASAPCCSWLGHWGCPGCQTLPCQAPGDSLPLHPQRTAPGAGIGWLHHRAAFLSCKNLHLHSSARFHHSTFFNF